MDCLVKVFKGVVENDLPKPGEIKVQVTDPSNFVLLSNGNSPKVRANSAVLYYLDANRDKVGEPFASGIAYDYDSGKRYGIGVEAGFDGVIWLDQKYNALDLEVSGAAADLSSIITCRSITVKHTIGGSQITAYPKAAHEFSIGNCDADSITSLSGATSVVNNYASSFSVNAAPGTAELNISELITNWPNIEAFTAYSTRITNAENGLADLGKLVNLAQFTHVNTVSWTLEDFVANKRSAGVTSGTCNVRFAGDDSHGGVASFNGVKMTSEATEFSWTATTITYNGVTIDA